MTKQQDLRPTAKIYTFPPRPRATPSSHRHAYLPAQQQLATALETVECGAGWYHDAAIEESDDIGDFRRKQH